MKVGDIKNKMWMHNGKEYSTTLSHFHEYLQKIYYLLQS
jgi:hypothetical protein